MPINAKQVLEGLGAWVQARGQQGLALVSPLQGGYEAWFQADFGGYLNSVKPGDVAREQPVYLNSSERVDLLINPTSDYDKQILIEVKTQRTNQLGIALISEVQSDLDKLDKNRNNLYTETDAYMLVITIDPIGAQSLSEWAPSQGTVRIFNRLQIDSDPFGFLWAFSATEGDWEAQIK
ncbi:hypothetical protein ACQR18_29265 [Bradyrhizobium oligotrophicum]|uniref:hypothetical protein n=1 Tax=Bradyrhizobium oligotrophicum TaxID=44255 RepID=UPI003EBA7993